jgi:hypothetical protein
MVRRPCPNSPAFWKVVSLEKDLMARPASETTLAADELERMHIEKAPQLNIDDPIVADAYPVFFQPLDDTPRLRNAFVNSIGEGREWSHCPDELAYFDRVSCAGLAISWLDGTHNGAVNIHNLYPRGVPQWHRA